MHTYQEIRNNIKILDNIKTNDLINLRCHSCSIIYQKTKKRIMDDLKKSTFNYCSRTCFGQTSSLKEVRCTQCTEFFKPKKTKHSKFCSLSCSAKFNNSNKKTGIRRSKLEIWIEEQLFLLYPELEILFNSRKIIEPLELDIYIPSLKLAFELNGIFHYEPIFGIDKFNSVKYKDQNKFFMCQKLGISLCVIDTSSQKYFKEQSSQRFLDIIVSLIESTRALQ